MACALLQQAVPLAMATARDRPPSASTRPTFPEAAELLLDVLEHADNAGNTYDDDNTLAALLEALGHLRLRSQAVRS